MTDSRTSADVEAAERSLQAAVLTSDIQALDRLLDADVVFTGADGITIDKATDLESHRSGALDVRVFDVEELTVRVVGSGALTFVLAHVQGLSSGAPFSMRLRYTRTWALGPDGWQVVAAHASALTDT